MCLKEHVINIFGDDCCLNTLRVNVHITHSRTHARTRPSARFVNNYFDRHRHTTKRLNDRTISGLTCESRFVWLFQLLYRRVKILMGCHIAATCARVEHQIDSTLTRCRTRACVGPQRWKLFVRVCVCVCIVFGRLVATVVEFQCLFFFLLVSILVLLCFIIEFTMGDSASYVWQNINWEHARRNASYSEIH